MAWLRMGDTLATHPRTLDLGQSQAQINEAFGWLTRCALESSQHEQDYFFSEAQARQFADDDPKRIAKAAERAGFLTRTKVNGRRGWLLVSDTDLFHMRLKAELALERDHRAVTRDTAYILEVRLRDGDQCRYCGKPISAWSDRKSGRGGTYDHVVPDKPELVVACRSCNSSKGQRTPEQAEMTLLDPPRPPYYSPSTLEWFAKYNIQPDGRGAGLPLIATSEARGDAPVAPTQPPAREAIPADAAPAQRPVTADLIRSSSGVPDLAPPGRDGPGQVGSPESPGSVPRARTRARGSRGRRGRPPTSGDPTP